MSGAGPPAPVTPLKEQSPECLRDLFRGVSTEKMAVRLGLQTRRLEYMVRGDFRYRKLGSRSIAKWSRILGVSEHVLILAIKETERRRLSWEHRIPGIDPGPLP